MENYIIWVIDKARLVIEIICGTMLVLMILIININVFYRYVLVLSLPWATELTRYLLVGIGILGASICLERNEHVSISFLYKKFSSVIQNLFTMIKIAIIGYVSIIFVVAGYKHALAGGMSSFLGIRLFYPRLFIPLGGVFLLLFLLKQVIAFYSNLRKIKFKNTEYILLFL